MKLHEWLVVIFAAAALPFAKNRFGYTEFLSADFFVWWAVCTVLIFLITFPVLLRLLKWLGEREGNK